MTNRITLASAAAIALIAGALPAFAHIQLKQASAPIGATYKAIFNVEHGCGTAATTGLRIQMPEGVVNVTPAAKSGWATSTVTGKYATTYTVDGKPVSEGATEVDFTGGTLGAKTEGTFTVDMFLTDGLKPNTRLIFPIVQQCGKTEVHWVQVPAAGKDPETYEHPGAWLNLKPKK